LDALTQQWSALADSDPFSTFYASPDFVRPWWNSFQDKSGMELCTIAVHDADRLVGLAPLAIHTEQRGSNEVRVLRFCGRGDYLTILLNAGTNPDAVLKRIFRALEHELDWDIAWLSNVPSNSPVSGYLLRSSLNSSFAFWIENPYINLREYGSFEDYSLRRMPAKARKYRNKFLREIPASFQVFYGDSGQIFERVAELHRLEKDFLVDTKGRQERHSLYEDPYRRRHIEAIFRTTDRTVTFAYTNESGELLAYRTCFRDGRRLLSWNSAYHPRISQYRPGKVLQYDILRYLYASGEADIFDFGAGRYPWKFEWTDDFSVTYRLHIDSRGNSESPTTASPAKTSSGPPAQPTDVKPARRHEAEPSTSAATHRRSVSGAAATTAWLRRKVPERAKPPLRRARAGYVAVRTRWAMNRPRPTIWYVPHPDDESIFMAGSLHANRSQPNVVVLLSRGGASAARTKINHRLVEPLDRESFMDARVREFRHALGRLEMHDMETVVLDLPDGAIAEDAVRSVVLGMESTHQGWTHRTMSFLDPHPDHRAAGRAVRAAHAAGEISTCIFHVPYPLVDDGPGWTVPLARADVHAKSSALAEYTIWDPDRGRFAVGSISVPELLEQQTTSAREIVHGPDVD
jgi:LmbE family N-acetylglucosaminyl deacetylase/CelD/BcsL family acetyltransferase involved in cellulose biosynthesis